MDDQELMIQPMVGLRKTEKKGGKRALKDCVPDKKGQPKQRYPLGDGKFTRCLLRAPGSCVNPLKRKYMSKKTGRPMCMLYDPEGCRDPEKKKYTNKKGKIGCYKADPLRECHDPRKTKFMDKDGKMRCFLTDPLQRTPRRTLAEFRALQTTQKEQTAEKKRLAEDAKKEEKKQELLRIAL
jgi:hypothetical protein